MANCITYNCDDLTGAHDLISCGVPLEGGISDVILLACGAALVDPSDPVEIQGLIDTGEAWIIKNVKVGIDAASPVTVDAVVAGGNPTLTGYDRTATLYDANVTANNQTFYNSVFDGRSFGGMLLHENSANKQLYIDEEINIHGGDIVPNDKGDAIRYEAAIMWRTTNRQVLGTLTDVPAGIYD